MAKLEEWPSGLRQLLGKQPSRASGSGGSNPLSSASETLRFWLNQKMTNWEQESHKDPIKDLETEIKRFANMSMATSLPPLLIGRSLYNRLKDAGIVKDSDVHFFKIVDIDN